MEQIHQLGNQVAVISRIHWSICKLCRDLLLTYRRTRFLMIWVLWTQPLFLLASETNSLRLEGSLISSLKLLPCPQSPMEKGLWDLLTWVRHHLHFTSQLGKLEYQVWEKTNHLQQECTHLSVAILNSAIFQRLSKRFDKRQLKEWMEWSLRLLPLLTYQATPHLLRI